MRLSDCDGIILGQPIRRSLGCNRRTAEETIQEMERESIRNAACRITPAPGDDGTERGG